MKILFVYGSLMKDRSRSKYMKNAEYIGKATVKGFAIYDLVFFPGIRPKMGKTVAGEVYAVNDEDFRKICRLEGEGILYSAKEVKVFMDKGEVLKAVVFIYENDCEKYAQELDGSALWKEPNC